MSARDIIARDFDQARQDMLAEFRRLLAVKGPETATQEISDTLAAMQQIVALEEVSDAG